MKKILILLLFPIYAFGQTCTNYFIPDSLIQKTKSVDPTVLGGSCASPDGTMNSIPATPGNYQQLLDSGYCFPIVPTKNFTMCFTFVSTGTDIDINAGFSSSGCNSVGFNNFNLYTCSPSCVYVGTGVNFTGLIPGQCYVWCLGGHCGGPGPGFDHICPYWTDVSPLPLELCCFAGSFKNGYVNLSWMTMTETNTDKFIIQRSKNGESWSPIGHAKCQGNSSSAHPYAFIDYDPIAGVSYYRLMEVDLNGTETILPAIVLNSFMKPKKIVGIYNQLGQVIDTNSFHGIFYILYDDGSVSLRNRIIR
jgi:hypothetical protein